MARLVKLSGKGPVQIKAQEEKWVCACGLSKNYPFCDGSHKSGAFFFLSNYNNING